MAKRLITESRHSPGLEQQPGLSRPLRISLLLLGFTIAAVATAVVTAALWHRWTLPSRIAKTLPASPERPQASTVLIEQMEIARNQATGGSARLEGVEQLARLYHANGYLPEAAACWNLLAAEQPRQGRWTYYLADIAATIGNTGETRNFLRTTVGRAPTYAPAWLKLADLEFKTGNPEGARSAYERRLELEPDDPYARLGLARLSLQAEEPANARATLEEILNDHPDFSAAHNILAEILARNGESLEVRQHRWAGRESGRFRQAADPWLDDFHAWCYDPERLQTLGTMADQTGDREHAIRLLKRAIDLSSGDPYGYALLGDAYLNQGAPAAAREVLEQGLSVEGETAPVDLHYVALARAWRELGQPEEAIRIVREGIRRIGPSCELYDALGISLGETGAFAEAAEAFSAALAEKPGDTNAHYNKANALLNLGREKEALHHLKQSLILQPTFPKSLFLLARYEMEAGDLDAAGDYLRPLYLSHPEQDRVRELMAAWLSRRGKQAENAGEIQTAEALYREGLEAVPDSPSLTLDLGVLLLLQDRVPEALPLLEYYHRLEPDVPQGALFLGQAYARTGRFPEARSILEQGAALAEGQGNAATAAYCREILSQLPTARK